MKSITEFIYESNNSKLRLKLGNILSKLIKSKSSKDWKNSCDKLQKFVEDNNVINYINKKFNFNNKDSYIKLFEFGGAISLVSETSQNNININNIDNIKSFIRDDNQWKFFKEDNNFAWYLPALEKWSLNIVDMLKYEKDIIQICKAFYNIY